MINATELVKDVVGWEGKYSVTSDGRIFSHLNQIYLQPCEDGDGYSSVTLRKDGRQFCARIHRLVGMAFLGLQPKQLIDHKDRDRKNNRVDNLRVCTNSQNQHNTTKWKTNSSGYKGVYKQGQKWIAMIKVKGKTEGQRLLGKFSTPEAAAWCYINASKEMMGEFSRV